MQASCDRAIGIKSGTHYLFYNSSVSIVSVDMAVEPTKKDQAVA